MKLLRKWGWLGLAAATMWFAVRLAGEPLATPPESGTTLTDLTGRQVGVPRNPVRILSLSTAATRTLVELGEGLRLVAIDSYGTVVPGTEHCRVVGKGAGLSRELLVSLHLDLAFIWWYQDEADMLLADAGIPTVRVTSVRAAELPALIGLVRSCIGLAEENRPAAADAIPAVNRTPTRVYLELYGPYRTVGRESYLGDLLALAGGVNVAGDLSSHGAITPEQLLAAPPDVVLYLPEFTSEADLRKRGIFDPRQTRFVPIHRAVTIAGPGWRDEVSRLHAAIHPESE